MLPHKFPRLAFVDLETTGGTATADRITEVGIVAVDANGAREWSCLVNPQMPIPGFIESLTGITNEMVAQAPTFAEVAAEIHARLEGCLFIAHNARFDHGFLKNEFKRTAHDFRPTVLCTVKLSRKLYPGFARHNLDALIERHRLTVTERHRALGDARLIHQFWQRIYDSFPVEQVEQMIRQLTARPALPSQLDTRFVDDLPTTHGVYLFYGENDLPLYVGKANNLRQRVLSHFSGDHQTAKDLELSQQIRRIEWIATAGEIGALLKEAALIKERMPAYNSQLRRNEQICSWRLVRSASGAKLKLAQTDDLFFGIESNLYGLYANPRKALNALEAIVDQHRLCPGLLGIEKVRPGKPCFSNQVKRCAGACIGSESIAAHSERLAEALETIRLKDWPYPGPVGIKEGRKEWSGQSDQAGGTKTELSFTSSTTGTTWAPRARTKRCGSCSNAAEGGSSTIPTKSCTSACRTWEAEWSSWVFAPTRSARPSPRSTRCVWMTRRATRQTARQTVRRRLKTPTEAIMPAALTPTALPPYAELHCCSNFSFLCGASHPGELVERAAALGYFALAITDECSLAGVVRAHVEAKQLGLPLLIGSEFFVEDNPVQSRGGKAAEGAKTAKTGLRLILLATNLNGYGNLSELITLARRRSKKGHYSLTRSDLDTAPEAPQEAPHLAGMNDCLAIYVPDPDREFDEVDRDARWLAAAFAGRCWIAVELLHRMNDDLLLKTLRGASERNAVPLVAAGGVVMHLRSRKPLQDTLTSIRLNQPIAECGYALQVNAEQHLRSRLRLSRLYPADLLHETLEIAKRCTFSLDELRYEYPEEVVPSGETQSAYLRRMVEEGAALRYPAGMPAPVRVQIEHELALIAELHYESYFLTVFDIVRHARTLEILCQGRGSAANSAVCYCLGITEIDPARGNLLFERFISRERNEPPDIDVDFEHQRREEVMQYIYGKYGRHRAALAASVATYRTRSALRDVGKALGVDLQRLNQLTKSVAWFDGRHGKEDRLREQGFDTDSPIMQKLVALTDSLLGFPRHLSQHVGGFVIHREKLCRLAPIENAAMPDRTVIQWDKDDLEALGLMKVDVLALGMLSAIRRMLDYVGTRRGAPFRMQDIPPKDKPTFDMLCRGESVGVFQVESRAQMSMLPRLRPQSFYDLVVEVAIVRPGPIQGGMVHPYLRRRQGIEEVTYPGDDPGEAVKIALDRTLGVPIFQEQVMQLCVLAAGFTPGEADQLRRAMAAWKRRGSLNPFHAKILEGMTRRGYTREFAEQIFAQIQGFGEYGFPESHAASFALLVYVSAWLRCHEPAAFFCGLLNSQPMGFYSASQLVQDGKRIGVEFRPVDVTISGWDCSLEDDVDPGIRPAVRLGMNLVCGIAEKAVKRIVDCRNEASYSDADDLARRAELDSAEIKALAAADALRTLSGNRREARWAVAAHRPERDLMRDAAVEEAPLALAEAPEGEEIVADYASLGLTLRRHPLALLRPRLAKMKLKTAAELRDYADGRPARTTGIVTVRQRPGTAGGTMFVTLEDETGVVNVIVWKSLLEKQRKELLAASLLTVYGTWQCEGEVRHLIAKRVVDHTRLLGKLAVGSRDFH